MSGKKVRTPKPAPIRQRTRRPKKEPAPSVNGTPPAPPPAKPLFAPSVPPPPNLPGPKRLTVTFSCSRGDVQQLDEAVATWQRLEKDGRRVDRSWLIREALRHYAVCLTKSARRHGYFSVGGAQTTLDDALCEVDPISENQQGLEDSGPGPRKGKQS